MDLIDQVEALAREAARATMNVYRENFDVEYKKDARESPLTEADRQSHRIITTGLEELTPEIPIISEEDDETKQYSVRRDFNRFWLIDPLDGTKEFVNQNGEFTVNIGLIENNIPVSGVVVAPVPDLTYRTDGRESLVKRDGNEKILSSSETRTLQDATLVHSRSHSGEKMDEFLDQVNLGESKPRGSSLKICMIAEGSADIYVRFRPTWEWDTAAADAVLRMTGGKMTEPDGNPLSYNSKNLKNDRGLLATNGPLHATLTEEITEMFDHQDELEEQ